MRILHAASYVVQPWKNGAGETTEIIASPAGAGFVTFDWRVSMARVTTAGPFSMFPGIDRSLGLIDGEGIVLTVEGRGETMLRAGAHPAVFPGDVPVSARLVGGPILDLNVMTRRDRWRHHLTRQAIVDATEVAARGDAMLAIVRGGSGTATGHPFADGDSILLAAGERMSIEVAAPADLWIADLWQTA